MIALGYLTFSGYDSFEHEINNIAPEVLQSSIQFLFGSVDSLFMGVKVSFYFGIVAHVLEAIYVAYLCQTKLKLNIITTLSWFVVVTMVGYPMTLKVLNFVSIHNQSSQKKKKN